MIGGNVHVERRFRLGQEMVPLVGRETRMSAQENQYEVPAKSLNSALSLVVCWCVSDSAVRVAL
jgi:hypothetical protein